MKEILAICVIFLFFSKGVLPSITTYPNASFPGVNNLIVRFNPFVSMRDSVSVTRQKYTEVSMAPLLQKVVSRFSTIFIHITEDELMAKDWRFVAVLTTARINLQRKSALDGNKYLQIWISFHYVRPPYGNETTLSLHMSALSSLCTKANAIHPGTIYTVAVHFESGFHSAAQLIFLQKIFLLLQNHMTSLSIDKHYKLGMMYDINKCSQSTTTLNIMPLMKMVSPWAEVVFIDGFSGNSFDGQPDIDDVTQWIYNQVWHCRATLERVYGSENFQFAFLSPDTPTLGETGVNNFLQYWVSLATLSEQINATFIMNQAFDTMSRNGLALDTRGWWRLVENFRIKDPSEYVFIEKASLLLTGNNSEYETLNETWLEAPPNIFPKYGGVSVYSKQAEETSGEQETIFYGLWSQICKQFSTMAVEIKHADLPDDVRLQVLTKFSEPEHIQKCRAVQITMVIDISLRHQYWFEMGSKAVRKLMKMTKGEKKGLTQLVYRHWKDLFHCQEGREGYLEVSKLDNGGISSILRYGVMLELKLWCLQENNLTFPFDKQPWKLLTEEISVVVITAKVNWLKLNGDEERYLPQFIILLEICRSRVKSELRHAHPSLETLFLIDWPQVSWKETEIQKMSAYVRFWEAVSSWAESQKVTVILGPAFDERQHHHKGWWSPTTGNTSINSEAIFEDKKSALMRLVKETQQKSNRKKNPRGTITNSILTGLMSTLLFITFGVSVGLMVVLRRRSRSSFLTQEEITTFFQGGHNGESLNSFLILPYDKTRYEIKKKDFSIDDDSMLLGDGQFGRVYKGKIIRDGERIIRAAIKVPKTTPPRAGALLGLLSEVKVLMYVGKHKHIVGLLGANTEDIYKGIVYVFLECCHLGSLHKYLKLEFERNQNEAPTLDNVRCVDTREYFCKKNFLDNFVYNNLFRWSREIATGMSFLASKYVVHADLATRNVLLTIDGTVKISDFGLSRRMYNYQCYAKTGSEPLPWKWMAPESLRFSKFTERSDVWAFGVTLWEIYSLGETPYPGIFWDVDFSRKLEDGLRLPEPLFNEKSMCVVAILYPWYNLMQQCWATNPKHRPTFIDLLALLELIESGRMLTDFSYVI